MRIRSDYAVQMTTVGYQDTMLLLDAIESNRVAFDSTKNSGARNLYPNAWATILKGTGGVLISWMDRSYGNGTAENVAPDQPLIAGGGASNTKFYHRAFRSFGSEPTFSDLLVTPNYDYKWRGGYVIQADTTVNGYDVIADINGIKTVQNGANYY